jgi:transposase
VSTFTARQLAERYGVSIHTILAWIREGSLAAVNIARHEGAKRPRWRISEQAVELFELRRQATPRPPRARARRKQPEGVIEFYK